MKNKKFISAKGAIEKRVKKMLKRLHARGVKVNVTLERYWDVIEAEHFIVYLNNEHIYAYAHHGKLDSEKEFDYSVARQIVKAVYYPF